MHEKLKTSFDHIHAESDLKNRTQEFLFRKMHEHTTRTVMHRNLLVTAICLIFLLAGFGGGYWIYFTPVSVVSIDINPSIEFKINRFDRVLSVEGYNDDGIDLASALNVRFMDYMDAINQVLKNKTIIDYLDQDEILSIMVISADGGRQSEMLANVEYYVAGYHNVYCGTGKYEDVSAAHAHGLSCGKYQAFLELQTLDPNITAADVQGWTMGEIRDMIDALSGTVCDNSQEEFDHHSQEDGHRHRNGWGN